MERTSWEMDNNRNLDAIKSGGKVGKGKNITVELLLESKIKENQEEVKERNWWKGLYIIRKYKEVGGKVGGLWKNIKYAKKKERNGVEE